MEKVTQDFRFEKLSRVYGEFLIMCADELVMPKIVTSLHTLRTMFDEVVSTTTTPDIAVLLKLRFSQYIAERPVIDFDKIFKEMFVDEMNYPNKLIFHKQRNFNDIEYKKLSFDPKYEIVEKYNKDEYSDYNKN